MDEQNKNVEDASSNLEFDEAQSSAPQYTQKESGLVQWILAHSGGIIENKKDAEYVLIGFIVLATLVSLYLFLGTGPVEIERNIDPITGTETIPGQISGEI